MGVVSQALERRRTGRVAVKEVTAPRDPQAITAAAALIPLDGTGWKTFKLGDQKWQRDAWHQFDINGDLGTIATWIGKACSRARLYIAEVDETGRPGKEAEDPDIQMIAETMFGSPAAKAEAQRTIGIHLFVPGESFIVAEAANSANEDIWYVVSTSDIRREGERSIKVRRPQQHGGGEYELKPGVDLLIRVWTPHPDKHDLADSSVRRGLIPLRQIEQYTKMEFAEVDSRLAGAGILFVPEEMDFPHGDKEKPDARGLTAQLTRTMSAAMVNREDASSMVPIVVQVPGELIGQIQHITFFSELQQHLAERMDAAVNRLARTLEIEPEILTGKADLNHWTAWQVDEATINIHVAPLLSRMCDALTVGYIRTALTLIGKDPDGFVLWYDTSALTVEPDRQKDALEMYDKGLISGDAARKAGSWTEGDAPEEEEEEKRFALHLVDLDPSKIEWPDVRKAIGGNIAKWEPPAAPAEGADMPDTAPGDAQPDTAGGGTPNPDNVRGLPQRQGRPNNQPETRQAAALRVGAHMAVQRALELAGKRLLNRENRGRYTDVPPHELHTRIRIGDRNRVETLLASADGPAVDLSTVAETAEVDEAELANLLNRYCSELMASGIRHDMDLLTGFLAMALHGYCRQDHCFHPQHPGWCDDDARAYHLPGRHNQKTHGHRVGKPRVEGGGTGPFTDREKRVRAGKRRSTPYVDPDRDASAEDRQGRRAFREWSQHARYLSGEVKRNEKIETAKVAAEVGKPEKADDREAAWKKVHDKIRGDYDATKARIQRKIDAMEAEGKAETDEDAQGFPLQEYREMLHDFEAAARIRIEEERNKFFGSNPQELVGRGGSDLDWPDRIVSDTGDNPIPVRDLNLRSGYKLKQGFAVRRGGVAYMIEVSDKEEANRIAAEMEAMHQLLPADRDAYQDHYHWLKGPSPSDAAWAERFGNSDHEAFASAGGRQISYWGRGKRGNWVGDTERQLNVHEFGHNRDVKDGTPHGYSDTPQWINAQTDDGDRWVNPVGGRLKANNPFRRLEPTPQPGGHTIRLLPQFKTAGGKPREAPYGVTEYGKSSLAEDFAEALRLYHGGPVAMAELRRTDGKWNDEPTPVYFRDLFPSRAALFDELYPDVAERQKAEIDRLRKEDGVRWVSR